MGAGEGAGAAFDVEAAACAEGEGEGEGSQDACGGHRSREDREWGCEVDTGHILEHQDGGSRERGEGNKKIREGVGLGAVGSVGCENRREGVKWSRRLCPREHRTRRDWQG